MKRYLGGEELPPKLMAELEQHVRACASCSYYLDAQKLKLAAKLSGARQEKVKAAPTPKGPKDSDVFTKPKQAWLTPKTLGLAAALALVLIAMSAVAKDPTLLFGPKASSVRPLPSADQHEADPKADAKSQSSEESHEEEPDSHPGDEHKEIGKIMTGETVQKEIEESLKPKPESESESHGKEGGHESSSASVDDHSTESAKKPPHEPVKPEPEPKMDLIVAEEGGAKKKQAPAPHPKTVPVIASDRSAPRRTSSARRPAPHQAAKPASSRRPATKPSPSGSIRIYDASGAPINP